jgi:hypothetical protein
MMPSKPSSQSPPAPGTKTTWPHGWAATCAADSAVIAMLTLESSFVDALYRGVRAQVGDERQDVADSLRQWRIVFGDESPACGADQILCRSPRCSA